MSKKWIEWRWGFPKFLLFKKKTSCNWHISVPHWTHIMIIWYLCCQGQIPQTARNSFVYPYFWKHNGSSICQGSTIQVIQAKYNWEPIWSAASTIYNMVQNIPTLIITLLNLKIAGIYGCSFSCLPIDIVWIHSQRNHWWDYHRLAILANGHGPTVVDTPK